jgi:ribosomal protein L12E/L44/L45/RPP1/RPP2
MTEPTTLGQDGSPTGQAIPLREEVSGDAARLAQTAKDRIDQAAEGQKQAVTGAARSATSAIDRAVSALREDDGAPDWLTKAFETTARQIEGIAGSIEGKNIDELRQNVTQFARQNPMAFLAASAAAGFAAARFLRAGSEFKTHQSEGSDGSGDTQQFTSQPSSMGSDFASADTPIYGATTTPEFTS